MAAVKAMVDRLASGTPPGVPANLAAPAGVATSAATGSSMKLSWSPVAGAAGYELHRGAVKVNATRLTGTSATDTGLVPATTYHWTVRAVDANGVAGPPSAVVAGTTSGAAALCYTDSNYALTLAGRAYALYGFTYAWGSNEPMGPWNVLVDSTLKQTAPNAYAVATC